MNLRRLPTSQQAEAREARDALIRSTAWQIAKDRGYSNAVFALPEAILVVTTQEERMQR